MYTRYIWGCRIGGVVEGGGVHWYLKLKVSPPILWQCPTAVDEISNSFSCPFIFFFLPCSPVQQARRVGGHSLLKFRAPPSLLYIAHSLYAQVTDTLCRERFTFSSRHENSTGVSFFPYANTGTHRSELAVPAHTVVPSPVSKKPSPLLFFSCILLPFLTVFLPQEEKKKKKHFTTLPSAAQTQLANTVSAGQSVSSLYIHCVVVNTRSHSPI
jgi:hypothetical protein